jgi:iron complex transport system ATP-binding protein
VAVRIEARGLTFAYPRSARPQVEALSLEVPAGRFLGIAGPNGAGKSTLLKLLAGLLHPRAGEVLLEGRPLAALPRRALAGRVAWVGQAPALPFPVTVGELVLSGRFPHTGLFSPLTARDREAAREAMETLGITALEEKKVQALSGGERQLAVLARALATGAPVLLLDEPVAHLDPRHHADILRVLAQAHRAGKTVLLSSHDYNLLRRLSTDLLLLKDGRAFRQAPSAAVSTGDWEALFGVPFLEASVPSDPRSFIIPRVE